MSFIETNFLFQSSLSAAWPSAAESTAWRLDSATACRPTSFYPNIYGWFNRTKPELSKQAAARHESRREKWGAFGSALLNVRSLSGSAA